MREVPMSALLDSGAVLPVGNNLLSGGIQTSPQSRKVHTFAEALSYYKLCASLAPFHCSHLFMSSPFNFA
jgi:hypothetical protein